MSHMYALIRQNFSLCPTLIPAIKTFNFIFCRKTCYGKGLRKLRSVFPRPYCIHSEGALDKNIYLMQPAKQMSDGATEVPQLVADAVCIQECR